MKLKQTNRYGHPQCQHTEHDKQCERPVYSEHRCWNHYGKWSEKRRKQHFRAAVNGSDVQP